MFDSKLIGYSCGSGTKWVLAIDSKRIVIAYVYLDGRIQWYCEKGTRSQYKRVYACSRKYKLETKQIEAELAGAQRYVEIVQDKNSLKYHNMLHMIQHHKNELAYRKGVRV